ncbi:ScbA/BarX family gamma-butyrolactone biosynthesis protein [Streptomyces finlayi]|uniref:ScbA/BarX family gamma-butyrolactone biosynthesis protein n=1 Tax=Streptomyces finlayi TaxID=67296 RepID=UPI002155FDFC|nr:ScbA/BarX family gamma-butyrolactone biosynthesis protein [Streptomyces finlayi]
MSESPVIDDNLTAVPKEIVHLRRSTSVFITDWKRLGPGDFTLTARWPAGAVGHAYDPRVLTQTIRQSGLVIAHAAYDVPLSHQTLLHDFNFTVRPGFRVPTDSPCALQIGIKVSEPTRRGKNVSGLGMDVHVTQHNTTVAVANSEFGWISPAAYRRLRGEHLSGSWNEWPLPAPVAPHSVGRITPADVALSATEHPHRWQLRNDADNTLLFDHPVDHVPGLALMEAGYQAANAVFSPASFEPTGIASAFGRYVEFDRPCWLEAEVLPSPGVGLTAVRVTGVQDEEPAFHIELSGPVT